MGKTQLIQCRHCSSDEIFIVRHPFSSVITEDEFIRGCLADRVLYQMLTADTCEPDR